MNEGAVRYGSAETIAPEPLSNSLRLLIVEDVPEDLELITLTLESADLSFTYDTVATVEDCRFQLSHQVYDTVLSDFRLPSFNGLQVLTLLKESAQDIPFILITGSLGEESAVECIKAGMTDYVLKDRLFRLPTVLERALQEFELRRQQKAAISKIRQQAWRETIINRIVQAMRETLDLDMVLQTMADQLHEALQVSCCSIVQSNPGGAQFTVKYVSQEVPNPDQFLGKTCELSVYYHDALRNDQPVVIHAMTDGTTEILQTTVEKYGILSAMLIPITYQRSYLGGICLQQCDRQRTWTEDEVELVKAIADQCAIALHQAKLYQQAQTELLERKKVEAQLRHDAFHDALTGLPNRALLMDRLGQALQLAQRRQNRSHSVTPYQFAVLFLDFDRFKIINDSLGHTIGDQLLKIVAQKLQSFLRMGDTIARLGGDEFVILLEDIQENSDAIEVAHRIHQGFKAPILLEGHEIFVSTSIGITLSSAHYTEPAQLLRDADIAMYRAKRRCRGGYEVFDASMHLHALRQLQLENDLQRAIDRQELQVYYQPIISLENQSIISFEALVRWQHPEQGMISLGELIPVAEETGLITEIDLWVLQQACHQLQVWLQKFPRLSYLTMNVNLSGQHFSQPGLIDQIDQVLARSGMCGSRLKLEITEGVLIENADIAATILRQFQERNIQVCLDDFGTGYSSLSYLHRFPVNYLKIDRSFIAALETEAEKSEIVKTIANLALNLGLNVVAEGVETERQLSYLQSVHCHAYQGYYFSPPVESYIASEMLRRQSH